MSKLIDLTGKRFGKLFVIERSKNAINSTHARWKCRCDCGKEKVLSSGHLISDHTKSCGCLLGKYVRILGSPSMPHGHYRNNIPSSTYLSWRSMMIRCEDSKNISYFYYGNRGISVCKEWHIFNNFLKDMGLRPKGTTLDRIDVDGDYEPSNCRWATKKVQADNRRKEIFVKNLIYRKGTGFEIDITNQNEAMLLN